MIFWVRRIVHGKKLQIDTQPIKKLKRWSNLSQQHSTCHNTVQQGGQTRATCCAQQLMLWYVALTCCDRLAIKQVCRQDETSLTFSVLSIRVYLV